MNVEAIAVEPCTLILRILLGGYLSCQRPEQFVHEPQFSGWVTVR